MSSAVKDHASVRAPREGSNSPILVREMLATVGIVAMWVAVLFVGVYGGEAAFNSVDSSVTTIPSGVFVALFAALATGSLAKRVFGRESQ